MQIEDIKGNVENIPDKLDEVYCESKLIQLKKIWKKEREEEKFNFAEVLKRQMQDKTKNTVI